MRDSGMSSSATTSATIVKRAENQSNSNTLPNPNSKCRCCPYGFHIDLGFVSYAQDVSNGFISRQGTPVHFGSSTTTNGHTNPPSHHKSAKNLSTDRQLTSPLDSIFSDSLENIMSDFEEALATHRPHQGSNGVVAPPNGVSHQNGGGRTQEYQQRLQNGYNSDYTTYRRPPFETPKPLVRPNFLNYPGSRSHTPNGVTNSHTINNNNYATALAKTVSEIRARNAESPFPDSRVGTPIDLGVMGHTNGHQGHTNGFHQQQGHSTPNYRSTTPSRIPFKNSRDEEAPTTPTPMFRRAPSHGDIILSTPSSSSSSSEFTSLRRGREYHLPDAEPVPRARFFSASPKLPRRLVLAPVDIVDTPPPPTNGASNGASAFTPVVTRSIAVATGPLPAPKPCTECPNLKKTLEDLVTKKVDTKEVETSTNTIEMVDKLVGEMVAQLHVATNTIQPPKLIDFGTQPLESMENAETQTTRRALVDMATSPIPFEKMEATSQTEHVEASTSELASCQECLRREDVFTRNVGVGNCQVSDRICVKCDEKEDDVEEIVIDENEAPGFKVDTEIEISRQRDFDIAKANAIKKLLTNEQKSTCTFQRNTAVSKSARYPERRKSVDDLDYIIDKNTNTNAHTTTTTPENSGDALKTKVVLKKDPPPPPPPTSKVPEPVAARIPRPKISKWAQPEECAETPDEEEEAQDRLTPLRSELRSLGGNRWLRNNGNNPTYNTETTHEDISDSDAESDCSANSDATFDVTDEAFDAAPFEISEKLRESLENYNSNLLEPGSVPKETVEQSEKLVQHEWMKTAARKCARYENVDKFVEELKNLGPKIVRDVVNCGDQNGNSALHYAVSHANFAVVSSILDCGEADLNCANKAGYTAVMLAALSSLEDDMERAVVQRLFEMGDVNAKASQHGQTALMLAVSHGKRATTELLLQCDANVNMQDEEGSTALMCAAEHGHRDLVKLLLSQPRIDASLTDCDSSTALSIAVENGHRDIGVLIYAHLNYSKLDNSPPTSII